MLENLVRQPNFTCLETVERTRQAPGGTQHVEDTLRLEVAVVDGKEMFAWPGAKEFEDRELRQIVATGMFGNGNYALYARMIFGGGGPRMVYAGEVEIDGRHVARFDFSAKAPESGYYLTVDDRKRLVGFRGSAYIDLSNGDLRRLEVMGQDIPPELKLTAAEDRVDYARVWIGDEEFLLPVESVLMMAGPQQVSRNRTRFTGCRKFAGESSVIFDDPEGFEEVRPVEVVEVALPGDAALSLEIRNELVLADLAVGDAVEAVLRGDVKIGKQVVAPKGAIAKGRVMLWERTRQYGMLQIQFTDIEWPGHHATVRAHFERRPALARTYDRDGALVMAVPLPRTLRGELLVFRTEK